MACDICNAKGTSLVDLRDSFQTDQIKSMCPECEKVVNKKCRELNTWAHRISTALTIRFMEERKVKLFKEKEQ